MIEGIKSCCYNFNSACVDDDLNKGEVLATRGNKKDDPYNYKEAEPHECFIRTSDTDPVVDERVLPTSTIKTTAKEKNLKLSLGERGYLKNYQFTGDYVMGANVVEDLQTYREGVQFKSDVSKESDHEMVFATFSSLPISGGRRKQRTHRKKHKQQRTHYKKHKQRRTRHKKRHTRRK